jgi:flagellar hook-associated protein 2
MATDYLSALNAGSGLNTSEIIESIVEAERAPKANIIETAKEKRTVAISGLGQVKTDLETFTGALDEINGNTGLAVSQVGTSVSLEITDAATATAFSNNITVTSLAAAHTLAFNNSYSSETAVIGTGTLTFSFGTWDASNSFTANSDRTSSTITVNSSNNTLAGLRETINSADMDVTASILKTGTSSYSLVLKSKEGANHAMRIGAAPDPADSGLGTLGYAAVDTDIRTVDATNAALTLDGVSISRESNVISDLVEGVTLTLKSTTSGEETITAAYDTEKATTTMQTFVDKLSALGKTLDDVSSRGMDGRDAGALAGDPLIKVLRDQIRRLTSNPITGFGDTSIYLADYGVTTNLNGTLSLDTTVFQKKYQANPSDFSAIINSRASSSSSLVKPSLNGNNYTPGKYTFDLDGAGGATLSGTAMTASGTSFSQTGGDAAGLSLSIIGSGSDADIYLGRSLLQTLTDYSNGLIASKGDISTKINNYNQDLLDFDTQIKNLDTNIEAVKARYITQFMAMEKAVASLNSTRSGLDNMMEAWKASMK